jgi:hypothetical protein
VEDIHECQQDKALYRNLQEESRIKVTKVNNALYINCQTDVSDRDGKTNFYIKVDRKGVLSLKVTVAH